MRSFHELVLGLAKDLIMPTSAFSSSFSANAVILFQIDELDAWFSCHFLANSIIVVSFIYTTSMN
jgi:hypothetical protein